MGVDAQVWINNETRNALYRCATPEMFEIAEYTNVAEAHAVNEHYDELIKLKTEEERQIYSHDSALFMSYNWAPEYLETYDGTDSRIDFGTLQFVDRMWDDALREDAGRDALKLAGVEVSEIPDSKMDLAVSAVEEYILACRKALAGAEEVVSRSKNVYKILGDLKAIDDYVNPNHPYHYWPEVIEWEDGADDLKAEDVLSVASPEHPTVSYLRSLEEAGNRLYLESIKKVLYP